jgi:hypothetical protein
MSPRRNTAALPLPCPKASSPLIWWMACTLLTCAVPVALVLRQDLLEVANARTSQGGQQSKAEQVYQYLTGPRFKQRIEAIVERFKDMWEDVDKERMFMMKA